MSEVECKIVYDKQKMVNVVTVYMPAYIYNHHLRQMSREIPKGDLAEHISTEILLSMRSEIRNSILKAFDEYESSYGKITKTDMKVTSAGSKLTNVDSEVK